MASYDVLFIIVCVNTYHCIIGERKKTREKGEGLCVHIDKTIQQAQQVGFWAHNSGYTLHIHQIVAWV